MNSTTLTGAVLHTYQAIFEDPPLRRPEWNDVRAMLEALCTVEVESGGNLTAARNGCLLTLHPALTKNVVESGEVEVLRSFLRESEATRVGWMGRDPQLLLVIHGATTQLYRCQVIGGVPQLVLPYQPDDPNPEPSGTKRKKSAAMPVKLPRENEAFASLADQLQVAGQIVVIGVGSGNEAATFVAWLKQHDSELSGRIIDTVSVDEQHLEEAGLLTVAREFYATLGLPTVEFAAAHPGERQWSGPRSKASGETVRRVRPKYGL